jgi:quercetin dioxygenase-like cupin family protein
MNMQNSLNRLIATLLASSTLLLALPAQADNGKDGKEAVVVLQKRTLPDAPGKKVMVVVVNYAPGQASFGHAHPGSVVAYVLEGAVVSQVKGEEPVTYKTGDSWYESPRIPHVVSRNASNTEPAKLLVWMLSNEEEGIKVPIDKPKSGS